ncbi:hypothetical protein niasHS_002605 [Heterodera schachtii]|uniref:Uncharacterized protein n=1 Tax=Heterodera schachtii TaxID=97005 RepID=A0ABD2KLW4_HETSC
MENEEEPQLHIDVLLNVAEKLIFSPDNDFRLDLRDPNADIVNFMFAGPACRWSFFSQFRKLTQVSVNSAELQLYAPKPIQGIRGTLSNNKEFFQGPFVVTDQFFYTLFCRGILRPTVVDTFFIFGNDIVTFDSVPSSSASIMMNDWREQSEDGEETEEGEIVEPMRGDSQWHEEKGESNFGPCEISFTDGESPAESLVRLFLFRDSPECLEDLSSKELAKCELYLDFVKIHDDTTVYRHINRILNLNAKDVLLEISTELRDIVTTVAEYHFPVIADRTSKLVFAYTIDVINPERDCAFHFPTNEFVALLCYIAACCPNLDTFSLSFLLQGEFSDEDFKQLSSWLYRTIQSVLSLRCSILCIDCNLTIEFRAFFPEATLMEANKTGHGLATMGEQRRTDDSETTEMDDTPDTYSISRKIQMRDEPPIQVLYSLVGLEEDSVNDGWNGY